MKTTNLEPTIREVIEGYTDNGEGGIFGYGGALILCPPYQRNHVYSIQQEQAVINTIRANLPLGIMYWADIGDGKYELMEGLQRTMAICRYIGLWGADGRRRGVFTTEDHRGATNLDDAEVEQILNYRLDVKVCTGTPSEKLKWYETINTAGVPHKPQELRNAAYHGEHVTDAKRYFSKINCDAQVIGGKYVSKAVNRQELLELGLDWISGGGTDNILEYMSEHQHDKNAIPVIEHFRDVIAWVEGTFPTYRKEMKGLPWGRLYDEFKDKSLDILAMDEEIKNLMMDDEVSSKKGIYEYVLTRKKKHLNLRSFTDKQKREVYERQGGVCSITKEPMDIGEMEADHITPWSLGGKTTLDNCQMISKEANRRKSNK